MKNTITIIILLMMQNTIQAQNWLDQSAYPFKAHYFETEHGKIHYIDEGEGEVILFVHGTPAWSFLYRNYIKELSKTHRCIAIDHLGFGLSDKPKDFAGTPQLHSQNLSTLVHKLQLQNITLVVHDFGGPIGLSYAIANPDNVEKIILFNTWLWGTKEDKDAQKVNKFLHSWLGNLIYLNTNFSPKTLFKNAFSDKKRLSKKVHQQYQKPFPNKHSRYGLLNIGKSLIGSSDWYQTQWEQIDQIKDKPFLVLWGMKDPFIKENQLDRWMGTLTNTTLHKFDAGHFVQEEVLGESLEKMRLWLEENQ